VTAPRSSVIETIAFSDAKARLSDLMTAVVHGHRPKAVGRHRGKEEMFLLGRDELLAMLEGFEFQPKVGVSDGEFFVRLPELGVIAAGSTLDEALEELVELAEAYAEDYLDRFEFFRQTDRRSQLPWVARVAATPPEARRALFTQVPEAAPELQPA
jgi:Antitoxin of toxin-antitoxin, RelE / RelB, TA system